MKVFVCLSALLAVAHCGPLNALLTSGAAAGPVHPATGPLVATKRGWRDINLEGYSEDDNQDGFVDPIGQVAPVAYHAPIAYHAPVAYHAPAPVVKTVAAPVVPVVKTVHTPVVTYSHHPVTYTHTVHAGNLVHTVNHAPVVAGYGYGLPVLAAAAPAAEEAPAVEEA